jgi:hypothetical protein
LTVRSAFRTESTSKLGLYFIGISRSGGSSSNWNQNQPAQRVYRQGEGDPRDNDNRANSYFAPMATHAMATAVIKAISFTW